MLTHFSFWSALYSLMSRVFAAKEAAIFQDSLCRSVTGTYVFANEESLGARGARGAEGKPVAAEEPGGRMLPGERG